MLKVLFLKRRVRPINNSMKKTFAEHFKELYC